MEKIKSLTLLSDIFPTGYHGCIQAGVQPGKSVYIAGAGPVGLAAAAGAKLLGASVVIVGDYNLERLAQAESFGCETINIGLDMPIPDQIAGIVGEPLVDCAVDAVGFEARGCGCSGHQVEQPAQVLNDCMEITRAAGSIGIPGLYVTGDPGAVDEAAKTGNISTRIGLGWAKSLSFGTGQCPVMKYAVVFCFLLFHPFLCGDCCCCCCWWCCCCLLHVFERRRAVAVVVVVLIRAASLSLGRTNVSRYPRNKRLMCGSLHHCVCACRYHKQLMNAILWDKVDLEKWCNVTMISLDEAPQGYADFDKGVAKKFVIDPHGSVSA